ncbi:MAG TPA: trigger factor [Tenuifilaceae bacterium]|nr:trigger factor [Tenuifilaceae bacterium]HPE19414.1 trigger factor [Tenuifilaceae bacterium]HPJ45102.1 trigger factor [Tenuifilaceae bacterium]HPQ35462.1 trigger factor [Tenuifilaceae bacterium]HRX67481.1 trigger factor [Tenuifilaceae bacterium]
MNVIHENTDALNAVLKVSVEQADYELKVEQKLKDYRKKAAIKGFRPGKAPASLISKLYKVPVMVEEVNQLVSESISKYITESKINILGEPLPSETQAKIDWDNDKNFEFAFDMGLAPEFEIKLSKRDKVPFHTIKVDKKMRDGYIENILSRYGSYVDSDVAADNGLLKVMLTELTENEEPKEGGISVENASVAVSLVADKDEQKKMVGSKVGDILTINVNKSFPNETDRASLLNIKKEELANISPIFQATVTEVKKYQNAELNQELFDKIYGEGTVKDTEEFNAKLDEDIKANLKGESEQKFYMDMREKLVEKFAIELPKEFLIRWFVAVNEGKFTREQVETDYPNFENDLKWQLIRDKIAQEQDYKVEEDEILNVAKSHVYSMMMQYGMSQLPDDFIENYAKDLAKKPEERRKFAERILENKVVGWVKEAIKLDEKEVSADEFNKLIKK